MPIAACSSRFSFRTSVKLWKKLVLSLISSAQDCFSARIAWKRDSTSRTGFSCSFLKKRQTRGMLILGKAVRKRNAAPSPRTALDPLAMMASSPASAMRWRTARYRFSLSLLERNIALPPALSLITAPARGAKGRALLSPRRQASAEPDSPCPHSQESPSSRRGSPDRPRAPPGSSVPGRRNPRR